MLTRAEEILRDNPGLLTPRVPRDDFDIDLHRRYLLSQCERMANISDGLHLYELVDYEGDGYWSFVFTDLSAEAPEGAALFAEGREYIGRIWLSDTRHPIYDLEPVSAVWQIAEVSQTNVSPFGPLVVRQRS
jgi:hypothetical protein